MKKDRALTFVAGAAVAAIAFGTTSALAAHQFSDVGDGHPFHDHVSAMADAGITTGFADGTFKPTAPVTRQAMAAFLGRGLGSTDGDFGADVGPLASFTATVVASTELTSGATGAGGGFAVVTASVHLDSKTAAGCPCEVRLDINDLTATDSTPSQYDNLPGVVAGNGFASTSLSRTWIFPMPADATHTFEAIVGLNDDDAADVMATGSVVAVYVPFGEEVAGAGVGAGADAADRN